MTEKEDPILEEKIRKLSESQKQYVTEEALAAKKDYDDHRSQQETGQWNGPTRNSLSEIEMFNENTKILLSVFSRSRFDEFIELMANPQRLFMVNFFIGICRGAGLIIGVLFILFLILYLLRDVGVLDPLVQAIFG